MIHLPKLGIFVLLLSILSWSATAQTAEGSKFIDGNFRINFLSGNGANTVMIGFSPSLGYLYKDNQALGGSLFLLFAEAGEGQSTSVGITPFVRRYLPIVEDKFFFIAQLQLSLVYGTTLNINDIEFTASNEVLSTVAGLSPGFVYFLSERWAINLLLNGVSLGLYGIGEGTVFGLSVGAGINSPNLGMSYYF